MNPLAFVKNIVAVYRRNVSVRLRLQVLLRVSVILSLPIIITPAYSFDDQSSMQVDRGQIDNDQVEPNLSELLKDATEKMAEKNESAARQLYSQALSIDPENLEALWNLSLLKSKEGYRKDEPDEMVGYYEEAKDLAEHCLDNYPEEASCYYVYAVAVGRISELAGPRARVRASREIKIHIEEALAFDPEHKGAWHLLGVWHSSAANLSRSERIAANLLFGGAPEGASNSEAEAALKYAIELDPENILFHLDLARFYRDVNRHEEAVEVLKKTLELEVNDKDDPANLELAQELLERLQ